MQKIENRVESDSEKNIRYANGKIYFSKKTEKKFYFFFTVILLLAAALSKAGIF
jgi:hypothetical protein